MSKQRAILCGYYGMGNAGDEALLVCLLQSLPDYIEPIVLSKNPIETRDRYRVKACDRWDLVAVINEMRQADFFLWGGGSLMQDSSSRVSPIYYGGLMKLAQVMGLKTIAWAQGLGPLNHRSNRWLTQHVLKRCQLVTVRDTASYDMLQRWKISATIAPDPVWSMEANCSAELPNLDQYFNPRILVNLREHSSLTKERLEIITEVLIYVQKQLACTIVLLPFQESLDGPLARLLQTKIPESVVVTIDHPQVMKSLFRGAFLFTIAMRLHAVIMSIAEEMPCFVLSYDPKVTRVMQAVNLQGVLLEDMNDDRDVDRDKLISALDRFIGSNLIQPREDELIQASTQHQDLLRQVLANHSRRLK